MRSMEQTPIAIDVSNLYKSYSQKNGARNVLKNVSFQLGMGNICCLLGPSGAGKTTLIKVLAGMLQPSAGNISIMGVDTQENPRGARQHIGWVPAEERSGLYGHLTGKENLVFFATLHRLSEELMARTLGNLAFLLDIGDAMDEKVLHMSAGARQKLGIAKALLANPSVLLFDEPFRHLDPHSIQRFRRLLKDHLTRVQKKTAIVTTHQLDEARQIADVVYFLKNGQLVNITDSLDLKKKLRTQSLEELYMKTIGTGDKRT